MGEIMGLIAQYGLVPVIVGALVYIAILVTIKRSDAKKVKVAADAKIEEERLEKERELARQKAESDRDAQLIGVVRELVQGPKHTVEEQRANRRINQFIVRQLDCLIQEGADRAYMFSFHNGGMDVLGRGFLKMSMTEEDVNTNIVPIMARYQNMPRMLFPKLYEQLDEDDIYNVDDVENIKTEDPFTYQFMTEHGAKIAMFRAIKREDGLMIGFVGMEYIYSPCPDVKAAGKNIDKKVNRIIGALLGQEEC